jgi:GNAT superfamily N-acetyltransferase
MTDRAPLGGRRLDGITIREATPDDAEIIYRQRLAMFEDIWGGLNPGGVAAMEATFVPWVRRGLVDGSYRGWLACNGDGCVVAGGGLIVHEWMANPRNSDSRRAYIANIYTKPDYRSQGIARCIMDAILDWCRAEGFKVISLHASPFGRPLYESLGFESTNEMRLSFE